LALEIDKGNHFPVRTITEPGKKELRRILVGIGASFCGMDTAKTLSMTWDSCVTLILNNYKEIGINEIEQAFLLCSTGKLDVDISAYYGRFTVAMLGKVLTAYQEKIRSSVMNEIKQAKILQQKKNEEEYAKQKNIVAQEEWLAEFNDIENFNYPYFNAIPFYKVDYWYTLIEKLSKEEKERIFLYAVEWKTQQLKNEFENNISKGNSGKAKEIQLEINKLKPSEKNEFTESIQKLAVVVECKKIAVFENRMKAKSPSNPAT